MVDVIDRANDHAEMLLTHALAKIPVPATGAGAEYCEDCGDES